MTKTYSPKVSQIKRSWHVLDAKGQVLGRLATQIAVFLMGKHKPTFARHLDSGDHVVVLNSEQIVVTGKKEGTKVYARHTGYPGGLRLTSISRLRSEHPQRIVTTAVAGMLPKNKLHDRMLKRLHAVVGDKNPYAKYQK